MGLHPRKVHRIVSMVWLLGSTGDVLDKNFAAFMQKDNVVIPDSTMSPPPLFTTAFLIDLSFDSTFESALDSPGGSIQPKKPLVEGEIGTAHRSSSSKAYVPGWEITGDSLLSDDAGQCPRMECL